MIRMFIQCLFQGLAMFRQRGRDIPMLLRDLLRRIRRWRSSSLEALEMCGMKGDGNVYLKEKRRTRKDGSIGTSGMAQ